MYKENRWQHGLRDFAFPEMPVAMMKLGCSLHKAVFDASVGEEIYAFFREDAPQSFAFSELSPITTIAHSGLANTPFGTVAFIVWQIGAGTSLEVMLEQYLNPFELGAIQLVASAANQSHFKLIIVDRASQQICSFLDYENNFGFAELATGMALATGHEEKGDFASAVQYVMENMTLAELLAGSVIFAGEGTR
jgi:hypothetical protein